MLDAIAEALFQGLGEAIFEAIIRVPFAVFKWAWNKDFPDKPEDLKRADVEQIEAVPPSESSSYLWDREIDGP